MLNNGFGSSVCVISHDLFAISDESLEHSMPLPSIWKRAWSYGRDLDSRSQIKKNVNCIKFSRYSGFSNTFASTDFWEYLAATSKNMIKIQLFFMMNTIFNFYLKQLNYTFKAAYEFNTADYFSSCSAYKIRTENQVHVISSLVEFHAMW